MWKNAIRTQMFNANLHKKLRFLRPSHKKETVFLEEIYAYYVMSSRKLSDVYFSRAVQFTLLVFGKVE